MNVLSVKIACIALAALSCATMSCAHRDYGIGTTIGPGSASSGLWIDKLSEYVLMQQALDKDGSYGSYLSDLKTAKQARLRGDWIGQYEAMNRFIDKLDAREGGIAEQSARNIREYAYVVEPRGLHNVAKDVRVHPEITKWQQRAARAREEAEKSF